MEGKTYSSLPDFLADLQANTPRILLLHGDLGAGKTHLTQKLAKALGIEEPVTSPTFVIMNKYLLPADAPFAEMYHYDMYRLNNPTRSDLEDIAYFTAIQDPETMVVIEWPEHIPPELWPAPATKVHITEPQPDTRHYTVTEINHE